MNLTFIDTETTGILEKDVIIELAFIQEIDGKIVQEINSFFNNGDVKISLISKATHGIIEKDIKDFPIFSAETQEYKILDKIKDETIFVGHNVQFDLGMLAKSGLQTSNFIDTFKIIKHLFQEKEEEFESSYRQDVLKFYFEELGVIFPEVRAHSAMGDVLVLREIFKYIFKITGEKFDLKTDEEVITKMLELTKTPVLLLKINFGKYKGTTFEEIAQNDPKYLDWLANNTDNEDVKFTVYKWRG